MGLTCAALTPSLLLVLPPIAANAVGSLPSCLPALQHLHHLYLGWALALWAELDHWLSALTLAVGTGIFLQGTASYSFAPVFSERCFSSPSAAAFECAFTAPSPFTLTICSATGPMPSHSCH